MKTDLIQIVHRHEDVGGFGAAIMIEDFYRVRSSSQRAKRVLGPDPYFLDFQVLLMAVCEEFERFNPGGGKAFACVFEEQEEFSGRARTLFDKFKALNRRYTNRLSGLTYALKTKFAP